MWAGHIHQVSTLYVESGQLAIHLKAVAAISKYLTYNQ